jgi:cytochrome b561
MEKQCNEYGPDYLDPDRGGFADRGCHTGGAEESAMNAQPVPSTVTRILHLGLSVGVTLQLLTSTFMQRPKPAVTRHLVEALGFEWHEITGFLSLALIVAWFCWLFLRRCDAGPRQLLPWFSAAQRHNVFVAARRILALARQRRIPTEDESREISHAVHGLGALCALLMALTGALIWLGMSDSGAVADWARPILELHEVVSNFMWAYVVGHAAMALLHHRNGEDTLRRMFSVKRSNRLVSG